MTSQSTIRLCWGVGSIFSMCTHKPGTVTEKGSLRDRKVHFRRVVTLTTQEKGTSKQLSSLKMLPTGLHVHYLILFLQRRTWFLSGFTVAISFEARLEKSRWMAIWSFLCKAESLELGAGVWKRVAWGSFGPSPSEQMGLPKDPCSDGG